MKYEVTNKQDQSTRVAPKDLDKGMYEITNLAEEVVFIIKGGSPNYPQAIVGVVVSGDEETIGETRQWFPSHDSWDDKIFKNVKKVDIDVLKVIYK